MKRATINDVALTAGVSTFTASRALRGKDHVAAATRDKVLKAAKELNYTASRSAAALASGRTNRIAMLARERLAGWFMGELFDGLEGYLIAESDNVLLICKKDEEHTIRKYVNDAQIKLGEEYI